MARFSIFAMVLMISLLAFSALADDTGQPGKSGNTKLDAKGLTVHHAGEFGDDDPGAPSSGDGISDGSGWDDVDNPNNAPNSGDGIPDGPGWIVIVIPPLI